MERDGASFLRQISSRDPGMQGGRQGSAATELIDPLEPWSTTMAKVSLSFRDADA